MRAETPAAAGMLGRLTLGMPQLSPFGLAEPWALRDGGDRHWAMLSRAMGRPEGAFEDAGGRPLYAAFCATEIVLHPAPGRGAALLGRDLTIRSAIGRVSAGRIGSAHVYEAGGAMLARLRMVSTFVGREESGARRLARRPPRIEATLPAAPPRLARLAAAAHAAGRAARHDPGEGAARRLAPCPEADFNAVGLLYFPSYSRLAAEALRAEGLAPAPLRRRRALYFGNLDPGEVVLARIGAARGDALVRLAREDGAPLALVATR